MCIIIHRPAGAATRLSRDTLQRCATRNPDGFGMMWAHGGKLNTARYLPSERKTFIKRALLLQDADLPLVLHFRWATHGAVSKENTHPFIIEKGQSALMHNGILSIPCVKGWSDTRTFTNMIVKGLPAGWESVPHIRWMVEQATLGSKVAIMYADGKVTILHRAAGIMEGGIWYSNDGFRPGTEREEWEEAAAAWEAKKRKEEGEKLQRALKGLTNVTTHNVGSAFRKPGTLPIQSSALYRFEGVTICGWCLAREANADDALLVDEPGEGEQCELCYHSPHVPGSRNLNLHTGVKAVSMHPDAVDDEGRVCTGA